ncbi:MAG: hypothetical protein CM15mP74_02070 [Halieaceae bacterium]|nr:MAG: hypothetical protein CM15mP74_02070 [Halieaceae bacterium]
MERDRLELGSDPAQLYRAVGCEHCNMTGYRGRTGIYELIEIDEPLREAIHAGEGNRRYCGSRGSEAPALTPMDVAGFLTAKPVWRKYCG